jgi:pimeloyl-ACP methyl ester carboxylesterase
MTAKVHFTTTFIGSTPVLLARRAGTLAALPPVFWFHGFGVEKETHRKELAQLAEAGFLAVGVDAAGHGERRLADLDERIAAPREEAKQTMRELALQTAAELPMLIDELIARGLATDRVAVAGVSMGGYVTYKAAVADPRVRAAVSILGAPELLTADERASFATNGVALLSINGEKDVNVPPDEARAFHAALSGAHHRYLELAGAEHLVNEEQWTMAMNAALDWLS